MNEILKNKINVHMRTVIFVICLGIVILSIISVIFPALLASMLIGSISEINPFELGIWAIPIILINIFLFFFGFFYYKKKLPNTIQNLFKFILEFEVSKKNTVIIFTIILAIHIGFSINDFYTDEAEFTPDFIAVKELVDEYIKDNRIIPENWQLHWYLVYISQIIFQNYKIIPFFSSILLIILTYFFTTHISKKRFAGLISILVLVQSYTFQTYDAAAAYTNFWVLFYVFSLYMIFKKWYLSPVGFILSVQTKMLSIIFFPLSLLFILFSDIENRKKLILVISYLVIGISSIIFIMTSGIFEITPIFQAEDFWSGFSVLSFQFRYDFFIVIFLLPVTVGLFLISKKGVKNSSIFLIMIGGILLSGPILTGLTDFYIQPYRHMMLIVFFAISVGILFSKRHQ